MPIDPICPPLGLHASPTSTAFALALHIIINLSLECSSHEVNRRHYVFPACFRVFLCLVVVQHQHH